MSQLLICARNMITAEMFARQMFIQKFRMVRVPSDMAGCRGATLLLFRQGMERRVVEEVLGYAADLGVEVFRIENAPSSRGIVDVSNEISSQLGMRIARKIDEALRDTITQYLGAAGWEPGDLFGRLNIITQGGVQTYFIDSQKLITVHPVSIDDYMSGMHIAATVKIERHLKSEEPKSNRDFVYDPHP